MDTRPHPEPREGPYRLFLDFVNSLEVFRARETDLFATSDGVADWLAARELLATGRNGSPHCSTGEARRVREARARLFEMSFELIDRGRLSKRRLSELNDLLAAGPVTHELLPTGDTRRMRLRQRPGNIDSAVARIVASFAAFLAQGPIERLRFCANPECSFLFLDVSRTGRRRWCSMSTCGNLAKVARYQSRQR